MYTYTHNFHEFPNLFPSKPLSSDISQPMTRFSFRILQATTLRWVPVRREVNGDMRWVCLRFWKLQWLQLSLATWSELGESNLLRSFRTLNKNLGIYRSYFFFLWRKKISQHIFLNLLLPFFCAMVSRYFSLFRPPGVGSATHFPLWFHLQQFLENFPPFNADDADDWAEL